jgi:drug/metabolite transporter (DMT)-like permease
MENTLGSLLAISSAGLEGLAQVALKQSSLQPRRRAFWVAIGLAVFAVEGVLYTAALQRLDLALAYSLGALSFVSVSLFSAILLRESVPRLRWLGIVCIVLGTGLLMAHG